MTDPDLNPPAFREAVASYLTGHEAQFNYDALVHTFADVSRFHRWARLVQSLRPLQGTRVLSSGCGAGGSLLAYHQAGADEVHGVEVDAQFAHMSAARTADIDGILVHHLAPQERLPLEDRSVDVIEAMDVIEHVPDPLVYLRELRRVLAPGGMILLVTPNRLWPVEQHLGIVGPPWLSIGLADKLFGLLARLPWLDDSRREKYRALAGIRTQNMSLWGLRGLAHALDLQLRVLHREDEDSPITEDHPWAHRLLAAGPARYLSPAKSLTVTLQRRR